MRGECQGKIIWRLTLGQANTSLSNIAECYDFIRVFPNEFDILACLYSVYLIYYFDKECDFD